MQRIFENLVIGGGPAGSMAALRLARAGREVALMERERGPHHKVCGEFLSGEAVAYLGQIGIDLRVLGAAPIERVRLSAGRRVVEAALPFRALSLSRKVLDEAMLAKAAESGCELRRGFDVESLHREGALWRVEMRGAQSVWARTVFLATGKHDVRGWNRDGGKQADLVGFKMHWRLKPAQTEALRGAMQLYLFPDGYGGMSLVDGDAADFCFVIRRRSLQRAGGWEKVVEQIWRLNDSVGERLDGAEALYERPLAISPIPYGYLAPPDHGVWRIGDQAAVIPSFTGDGMSIALHSATLAANMHLEGRSASEFNHALRMQLRGGMHLATMLSKTMVTSIGQKLAPIALAVVPGAFSGGMRWIAASTRIPERALAATFAPSVRDEALRRAQIHI